MRIASHGHASTHRPHTTQRSSSISNTAGYFSTRASVVSAGMMVMQLAGHTVGQHMQATHLTVPSSRCMSRWRPRLRGGYGFFSSGYWMVSTSALVSTFLKKCFTVIDSPLRVAGRKDESSRDGRATRTVRTPALSGETERTSGPSEAGLVG